MDYPGPATNIRDAYRACDLGPLEGGSPWWVDLSEARGSKAVTRLETYYELCAPDQCVQVAFTGHRGCGKSTELLRLQKKWEERFFVVYFPVTELLDANDVAFSDLFLTIAMKVAQTFHDARMPLNQKLLGNVEEFTASVIRESTQTSDSQIGVDTEAAAGVQIPFFANLKARITSQLQAATQHKETIRRIFERDITRLITDTNLLLDDARSQLRTRAAKSASGPEDLLIVLDNLDRLPPDVGERLVFQHGDFLKQIRAHIIYTVPVSVLHSPKGLGRIFPEHDMLPMVKVFRHHRKKLHLDWSASGVEALMSTAAKRVDTEAVFESRDCVLELARYSGGCLRHLMQLIRDACQTAHARKADKVSAADTEDALRRMQFDFERMIPPEHYPVLAEVARTKRVPNDDLGRQTLYNLTVLEYDGQKRWNYVHPVVRRVDRFGEELRAKGGKGRRKAKA